MQSLVISTQTLVVVVLIACDTLALFPGLPGFCWSSTPVYYCEHKRKLKGREAWEQGQCDILVGVILNINTPQDGGFRGSNEDQIKFIFISTMVHLPF